MKNNLPINLKADHISGGFEWERKPSCSCGQFAQAIEDKFIFVSNFTEGDGTNLFYLMPLDNQGCLFKSDGIGVTHCLWCGDKINGRKKYEQKNV